ncbi:amino acid--tRNA ligase-related protein, partial [Klebsiella pneumoniae]|uniref:amino acid--tRNA ligase-related protein n=1 Tax=Klebsiella pneumoniae TaxID=573 RepID=UPI003136E2EE
ERQRCMRDSRRCLDLIASEGSRHAFGVGAQIRATRRRFMVARGCMEVEAPMMQGIPGGASARPFIAHHNALELERYLRSAPE